MRHWDRSLIGNLLSAACFCLFLSLKSPWLPATLIFFLSQQVQNSVWKTTTKKINHGQKSKKTKMNKSCYSDWIGKQKYDPSDHCIKCLDLQWEVLSMVPSRRRRKKITCYGETVPIRGLSLPCCWLTSCGVWHGTNKPGFSVWFDLCTLDCDQCVPGRGLINYEINPTCWKA